MSVVANGLYPRRTAKRIVLYEYLKPALSVLIQNIAAILPQPLLTIVLQLIEVVIFLLQPVIKLTESIPLSREEQVRFWVLSVMWLFVVHELDAKGTKIIENVRRQLGLS